MTIHPVIEACRFLTALDADHAKYQNASGWNKPDSYAGHQLAHVPDNQWDDELLTHAARLLLIYKNQLEAGGIDYQAIKDVADDAAPQRTQIKHEALLAQTHIIAEGERVRIITKVYDPRVVAAIKKIDGRRYDPESKTWSATPGPDVLTFAKDWGFHVEHKAEALCTSQRTQQAPARAADTAMQSTGERGVLLLSFRYDATLVARVKEIPGRRYLPNEKQWKVPVSESSVKFIRQFEFTCSDDAKASIDAFERNQQHKAEAQQFKDEGVETDPIPIVKTEPWGHQVRAYWFFVKTLGLEE